jgi:hypothetical protein
VRSVVLALAMFPLMLLAGCATAPTRPPASEFDDIPVPKGLHFHSDKSVLIETPSVKAARLVYRGRIQPDSLATAMRTTLEANGWRNVSSTAGGGKHATQVYEKAGTSLQVQIWEGLIFTYVEITTGRGQTPAR